MSDKKLFYIDLRALRLETVKQDTEKIKTTTK